MKLSSPDRKKISAALTYVLPLLVLALLVAPVFYYIVWVSDGYLHSDCTDSILWSQAMLESGKLFDPDFQYAAVLPFGGNLIFLLPLMLFGYSMKAQTLGMLIFFLLFVGGAWYFARGLELSRMQSALFASILTLYLSAGVKLREIMWEHIIYYSLGTLFFLYALGLLFHLLRKTEQNAERETNTPFWRRLFFFGRTEWCLFVLFCLYLFLISANGLQSLILVTLPLLAGVVWDRAADETPLMQKKRDPSFFILLVCILLFTFAGLLAGKFFTKDIPCGYADAYSSFSAMSEWTSNLLKFPEHYFSLFGVQVKQYQGLADSFASVTMCLRLCIGILLLVLPFTLLWKYKTLPRAVRILAVAHFSLCFLLLFAYTFGLLAAANWRLTPFLASCILTSLAAVFSFPKMNKLAGTRFLCLFLAVLLVFACIVAMELWQMPTDDGEDSVLFQMKDFLLEKDLTDGYATFWYAQALTLLTDNQSRLRGITVDANGASKYTYQQKGEWYKELEAKEETFMLLTYGEAHQLYQWLAARESIIQEVWEEDTFVVYVFAGSPFALAQ